MRLPLHTVWRGLTVRLVRMGCTNRPFYYVVAADIHRSQHGKVYEQLGSLDPMPNSHGEMICGLNFEGIRYWIARGARISQPVQKLLGLSGFYPIHPMSYITARRRAKGQDTKPDFTCIKENFFELDKQQKSEPQVQEVES